MTFIKNMSWKTKLLHTSASLGKAQVFKGRCLMYLKKNIILVKQEVNGLKSKMRESWGLQEASNYT